MRLTHEQRVARWMLRCTVDANGCWIWTGAMFRHGYGNVSVVDADGSRRNCGLHRVTYEFFIGPIPAGLQLDHLCRVPACCNPAHLEPVTCRENLLRGETVPARRAATTHCPKGHPYDEANTYRSRRGQRHCATCRRDYKRRVGI